jgi:hypothetical protein
LLFSNWGEGDVIARVRFARREDGRLEPAEVHVEGRPRVSSDTLRNVPLGHMEAWANGQGRDELIESITGAGPKIERATERWLTTIGRGNRDMVVQLSVDLMQKVRRRALQLRIPEDPKKPDAFYVRVAELYAALAGSGSRRPAREIADANDVPVTTVHRWVKEARARKKLGSGRRGKAG